MDFEFHVSLRSNRGALLSYLHSSPRKITKTDNQRQAQCVWLLCLCILLPVCCIQLNQLVVLKMSVLLRLLLNCRAFDFSMVWDRVLSAELVVYYYQYLMTLPKESFGILVISDTGRTYILLQNSNKPNCVILFFLVFLDVTLFFIYVRKWTIFGNLQLFLDFWPGYWQLLYSIYSDYTVNLKTYLILLLYLLLSGFVCGADLSGNKFLRLCVYEMRNEIISKFVL